MRGAMYERCWRTTRHESKPNDEIICDDLACVPCCCRLLYSPSHQLTMRRPLLAIVVAAVAAMVLLGTKPWQYRWAFGQDAGAAQSGDWKDKPCTRELADALYAVGGDTLVLSGRGNRFWVPGRPGHSYYVHGYRTKAGCEQARTALGDAQWNQSRK